MQVRWDLGTTGSPIIIQGLASIIPFNGPCHQKLLAQTRK
jgi:hypothetical protein